MFACLYQPPASACGHVACEAPLVTIAREFSPRYEQHRDDLVSIDVSGLGRLLGDARAIGEELRRAAASRGVRVHVAIAGTRTAAMVLAHARPGLTLVEPGEEAEALAPIPIGLLEKIAGSSQAAAPGAMPAGATRDAHARHQRAGAALSPNTWGLASVFTSWGLRTLGELAALSPADLAARLGQQGLMWQAIARGSDVRPLVPTLPEERFESSLELEWPIEGLEPLSFVLTRLLEPLCTRLERRDRGAAVLHVRLRLVTRAAGDEPSTSLEKKPGNIDRGGDEPHELYDLHVRTLQLPTPIRDVRTLRTLALLDIESHPPAAAIDRVTVVIDPTPGRVLQHTLFTRAQPTPEQLSTLVARLGALLGQDRVGAPAVVDSYRPGVFEMRAFESVVISRVAPPLLGPAASAALESVLSRSSHQSLLASALRRCRQPVPARVAIDKGIPVRVTTDRRGFAGGNVIQCAGPWRTSGEWWRSACGHTSPSLRSGRGGASGDSLEPGRLGAEPRAREEGPTRERKICGDGYWNRDEWDVALSDGAVYRIFQDRDTEGWFIDAIVD